MGWPQKAPIEHLDYTIEWGPTLDVNLDSISISQWTTHQDIVVHNQLIDGTDTVIWISGGLTGKLYEFVNTVNTVGGRLYEAKFKILVKERVCIVL